MGLSPAKPAGTSSPSRGPELGAILNLIVSAIAAGGIVAPLTNAVSNAGFVCTPLIYALTALWATYASLTLVKASVLVGGDSMPAVAHAAMGSIAGYVVEAIVTANAFACGMTAMAAWSDLWDRDMLEGLHRHAFLAIGAAVIFPPILVIRTMQACELLSIVTLISALLFLGTVLVKAAQPCVVLPELTPCDLDAGTSGEAVDEGLIYAFSIALNSFVVQFNVLDIYHSTARPDAAGGGESATAAARSFSCQVYTSMGVLFALYCAIAMLSYSSFGSTDYADILSSYKSLSTGGFSLSFLALGQLLSIPLVTLPAIKVLSRRLLPVVASMRRASPAKTEASALVAEADEDSGWDARLAHMVVATVWTLSMLFLCMAFGDLEVMLALFGTVTGLPLLCIVPPLLLLQCESTRQGEQGAALLHKVMLAAGIVVTIAGVAVSASRASLNEDVPDKDSSRFL